MLKNKAPARAALLADLVPNQNVTVWLHSQWKVTGNVVGRYDRTMTVLRLKDAKLEKPRHQPEPEADCMLVPVEDIQLIRLTFAKPAPRSRPPALLPRFPESKPSRRIRPHVDQR